MRRSWQTPFSSSYPIYLRPTCVAYYFLQAQLIVLRPFFAFRAEQPLHTGVRTGCHYLICLSVLCVCVTFVVFTDCESCTRPISTNPVSMEAGEYGPTRGTRFFAVCLEVVAVAGLMWVSWCVFGGAGFFLVFQVTTVSISYTQSSQRRLGEGARTASQSVHRELAPTYPHRVYRLVCFPLRNMASSVDQ